MFTNKCFPRVFLLFGSYVDRTIAMTGNGQLLAGLGTSEERWRLDMRRAYDARLVGFRALSAISPLICAAVLLLAFGLPCLEICPASDSAHRPSDAEHCARYNLARNPLGLFSERWYWRWR